MNYCCKNAGLYANQIHREWRERGLWFKSACTLLCFIPHIDFVFIFEQKGKVFDIVFVCKKKHTIMNAF
jgi:hypothetical protein